MSNPYDPNSSGQGGYGQQPYGQPYGSPYGSPYGQPYGQQQTPTDAVSITGFVLSLTCCLSIVGVVLGLVGLKRTSGGRRKGRWAAVSAILVGIVGTLATAGAVVFGVWFSDKLVLPGNAEVGQCLAIEEDETGVIALDTSCSEAHDAQVVYAGEAGDDVRRLNAGRAQVCFERMSPELLAVFDDPAYRVVLIVDAEPMAADDNFLCYLERADGGSLSERLP